MLRRKNGASTNGLLTGKATSSLRFFARDQWIPKETLSVSRWSQKSPPRRVSSNGVAGGAGECFCCGVFKLGVEIVERVCLVKGCIGASLGRVSWSLGFSILIIGTDWALGLVVSLAGELWYDDSTVTSAVTSESKWGRIWVLISLYSSFSKDGCISNVNDPAGIGVVVFRLRAIMSYIIWTIASRFWSLRKMWSSQSTVEIRMLVDLYICIVSMSEKGRQSRRSKPNKLL